VVSCVLCVSIAGAILRSSLYYASAQSSLSLPRQYKPFLLGITEEIADVLSQIDSPTSCNRKLLSNCF
jgi:hypothetical protein